MAFLVGFHVEGWDHLVLRAYLGRLLDIEEDQIEADWIDATGRGWQFVLEQLPKALRRFYGKCARLAVIGVDNDGNIDLLRQGGVEDPKRPRHWVHSERGEPSQACRYCHLEAVVQAARPSLNWWPAKPGDRWPVVVAVPVEMVEAWLVATLAILENGRGSLHAENEQRRGQKHQFYGKPEPSKEDVRSLALPLIRRMQAEHLASLGQHSRSFRQFAEQVNRQRAAILDETRCWDTQ